MGKCTSCPNLTTNPNRCDICQQKANEFSREQYKERILNSKCGRCGKKSITKTCIECKAKNPYAKRNEAKLCIKCGEPSTTYRCKNCGDKRKRVYYYPRKLRGLCVACGREAEENRRGKCWCKVCQNKCSMSHQRQKMRAVSHYTNGKNCCQCCGESEFTFLTIDHINNDGNSHRKSDPKAVRTARWVCRNNFPPGFQILCWNCQLGKHLNGGICPHKQTEEIDWSTTCSTG